MSAIKAGMSRKTASKYLKSGKSPTEVRKPHTWSTRKDPFKDVRHEIEAMLERAPELLPSSIFRYLQEKYPGEFHDGQLRTLERRVRDWKMIFGKANLVTIPQVHFPGKLMQLDWTCMNALGITIAGELFEHLLCHTILTYSNWEWAEIAFSESFLSLRKCFQNTVKHLGAVPEILQTDNSSTATHRVKKGEKARDFNAPYKSFLEHYNVEPQTTNVSSPNENGDIESANGHLKRRIKQYLLIRGSRDFSSIEEYQQFIYDILIKGNQNRTSKLKEELKVMRELPEISLPEYTEHETTVSSLSTVRVGNISYSVPSTLKGQTVRLHVYEEKIEVRVGRTIITTLKKERGKGFSINYRHVIDSFVRKPNGFENCRYKKQLFPTEIFSKAYEHLRGKFEKLCANKEYLAILNFAAKNGEEKVERILSNLIDKKQTFTKDSVKQALGLSYDIPKIERPAPSITSYDSFLSTTKKEETCQTTH